MIKETDASKCDERQVKNKPIPLTHKKKGETHTMGNQGMKIWKLSAFFVISLMLMAGLFADTATAQTVNVTPDTVKGFEILPRVTVTYSGATGLMIGGTSGDTIINTNVIEVILPEGWLPAYPANAVSFGAALTLVPGSTTMWTTLVPGANATTSSYITVVAALNTMLEVGGTPRPSDLSSNAEVAVTVQRTSAVTTADPEAVVPMRATDRITVTFYNVRVQASRPPLVPPVTDPDPILVEVRDSVVIADVPDPGSDYPEDSVITVNPPTLSNVLVSLSPRGIEAEAITDLTVNYIVQDTVFTSNTVTIGLPENWVPAYPEPATFEGTFREVSPTTWTTLPAELAEGVTAATSSYVTVTARLRQPATAADPPTIRDQAANASVSLAVTEGNMVRSNYIQVAFHNVKVQGLTARQMEDASVSVTESRNAEGPAYVYPETAIPAIEVRPPRLSTITVQPSTEVDAGAVTDVTVIYAVKDTVFKQNDVTVGLPLGWAPAYMETFGDTFRADGDNWTTLPLLATLAEGVTAATSSYVTVSTRLRGSDLVVGTDPNPAITSETSSASVTVSVADKMPSDARIVFTFHNVQVEEPAFTPFDAELNINDSITDAVYEKTITVSGPEQSTVTVTPSEPFGRAA